MEGIGARSLVYEGQYHAAEDVDTIEKNDEVNMVV
jgi:hypothetical protein